MFTYLLVPGQPLIAWPALRDHQTPVVIQRISKHAYLFVRIEICCGDRIDQGFLNLFERLSAGGPPFQILQL